MTVKEKRYKKGLAEANKDETSAPKMYARLYALASTKADKKSLKGILRQEKRHKEIIAKIQRRIKS